MEDFGTDSRMQARECSGLHDRGKGTKTPERPIKAHSWTFHDYLEALAGVAGLDVELATGLVARDCSKYLRAAATSLRFMLTPTRFCRSL